MLWVNQEAATPRSSGVISLHSLPFGRPNIGQADMDHLPTNTLSWPKIVGVRPDYLEPSTSRSSPQHLRDTVLISGVDPPRSAGSE